MTTIRTFIAIELSDEARSVLADLQNRLKAVVPPKTVRWTAPNNIHLTLHFLGDVALDDVEKVGDIVRVVGSNYQPYALTLNGVGCFPNSRRPRILWVGIGGKTKPLLALHRNLGEQLKMIGFTPETRAYSPHLTIGRVRNGIPKRHLTQLGEMLDQEKLVIGELATLEVNQISLIKSELKAAGAIYTPLIHGKFQGP